MSRKWYAADNSYGTNFTYDSDGWCVNVFDSKAERDAWVEADTYPNGNPTREVVTAKQARKIRREEDWYIHHGGGFERNSDIVRVYI